MSRKNERGATLVEFALIAPLLFLLLFGVIEFSRLIGAFTGVWTAAREGARYATTTDVSTFDPSVPRYVDCDGIKATAVQRALLADVDVGDIDVDFLAPDGSKVADCTGSLDPDPAVIDNGYTVRVTVDTEFNSIVPLLSSFLDGINLHSEQERGIFRGILGA